MTVRTSEELKAAFGTGEYPSSVDYSDLVDTVFDQGGGGVDLTGYATETYVTNAISALVDSAPDSLNTLNELAAALGDDENFASAVTTALSGKSDTSHLHDDRYYTESETDSLLSGKSDTSHIHDDRYYTKPETGTLLDAKTSTGKAIAMAIVFG